MPHKKELSDEELETMRANAPDRETFLAQQAYDAHQEKILEEIVQAGQSDILMAVNDLEQAGFAAGPEIFESEFPEALEDALENIGSEADPDDVLDVFFKKNLQPGMFYFGIGMDQQTGPYVVLVPIRVWEKDKCLDDRELEDYVAPPWLKRLMEAQYSIDGKTPGAARRELLKLGFVEKHEIAQ